MDPPRRRVVGGGGDGRLRPGSLAVDHDPGSAAGTWGLVVGTEWTLLFLWPLALAYVFPDGTVTQGPPQSQPQPGDTFEVESLDYRGNHKKHSKKPIGKSLLRFHGFDLFGATGRWKGGKLISNKDVNGDSDIVVRLVRR